MSSEWKRSIFDQPRSSLIVTSSLLVWCPEGAISEAYAGMSINLSGNWIELVFGLLLFFYGGYISYGVVIIAV